MDMRDSLAYRTMLDLPDSVGLPPALVQLHLQVESWISTTQTGGSVSSGERALIMLQYVRDKERADDDDADYQGIPRAIDRKVLTKDPTSDINWKEVKKGELVLASGRKGRFLGLGPRGIIRVMFDDDEVSNFHREHVSLLETVKA